jgi:hypothetical protein
MSPSNNSTNIPSEFICPITKKVMRDPMMSKTGQNFERAAIVQWLNLGMGTCPVTGQALTISNLVSNKTLQWKIQLWKKSNGDLDSVKELSTSEKVADMLTNNMTVADIELYALPKQCVSSFADIDILAALDDAIEIGESHISR